MGWRFLLQLDSDDKVGWHWVDAGRLYNWISPEDLRERDFRGVECTMQFK